MTSMFYLGLLSFSLVSFAGSSGGQVVSVERAPPVTSISATDLVRAMPTIRWYLKSHNPACYDVLLSPFQGMLRVDFSVRETAPAKCGQTVGFVIDERGRPLRRIYSR